MTCIGFHVAAGGARAIAWADSETYRDGAPVRHSTKLMVNALAGVVGIGCGWAPVLEEIDTAVIRALSLDNLVKALPDRMRHASMRHAARIRDTSDFAGMTYAVVGHSRTLGRLAGYCFQGATFFAPQLVARFASPDLDGLAALHPEAPSDVLPAVQKQMNEIRRFCPDAGAGTLTVADIRPGGIAARSFPDLGMGDGSLRLQVARQ